MQFEETILKGNYIVHGRLNADSRGHFSRVFCKNEFKEIGHQKEWVQLNHSYTVKKGVVRGMHFQFPPYQEVKMIKCIRGSVFDVAVDIRKGSPTFLQWAGVVLSADNNKMMYIPEGFAHGFQTLSEDSELLYFHSEFYTSGAEGGLRYNDELLKINWPLPVTEVSERDSNHPLLGNSFTGI